MMNLTHERGILCFGRGAQDSSVSGTLTHIAVITVGSIIHRHVLYAEISRIFSTPVF